MFQFIGQVSANSFNILSLIKLLLMMGVTFAVGIVLIDILDNKKTNSLILSVAIILGLVLNQNIIVNMLTTIKSKSSSSASKSSPSASRGKECRCCGKTFTHSGYKLGYGQDAFGEYNQIGVQPGPYDSEYCAFACEHRDGLLK